jgi:hypothetical protein
LRASHVPDRRLCERPLAWLKTEPDRHLAAGDTPLGRLAGLARPRLVALAEHARPSVQRDCVQAPLAGHALEPVFASILEH